MRRGFFMRKQDPEFCKGSLRDYEFEPSASDSSEEAPSAGILNLLCFALAALLIVLEFAFKGLFLLLQFYAYFITSIIAALKSGEASPVPNTEKLEIARINAESRIQVANINAGARIQSQKIKSEGSYGEAPKTPNLEFGADEFDADSFEF